MSVTYRMFCHEYTVETEFLTESYNRPVTLESITLWNIVNSPKWPEGLGRRQTLLVSIHKIVIPACLNRLKEHKGCIFGEIRSGYIPREIIRGQFPIIPAV